MSLVSLFPSSDCFGKIERTIFLKEKKKEHYILEYRSWDFDPFPQQIFCTVVKMMGNIDVS